MKYITVETTGKVNGTHIKVELKAIKHRTNNMGKRFIKFIPLKQRISLMFFIKLKMIKIQVMIQMNLYQYRKIRNQIIS